jgi:hypothetical protein
MTEDKNNKNLEWTSYHEAIFMDWCDNAMCYRYLHNNCNRYYHKLHIIFTIPVIFIATITGVANFAQERVPIDYQFYYTIGVGSFNILAGFISTVAQFLKINELNEAHRVSAISWAKLHRNIKIELIKNPKDREPIEIYLKNIKEQYDLLVEISPRISQKEIKEFNKKFKDVKIVKPEICGSLVSVKDIMYKEDTNKNADLQTVINIKERRKSVMNNVKIEGFIQDYWKQHNREATIEEIYDNLGDEVDTNNIYDYMKTVKDAKDANNMKRTKEKGK